MEEDIEILEELVQNIKRVNKRTLDCEIEQWCKEKQAIENLIKGYRELEEENKKWEEWAENAEYDMSVDYIPKSKVKEKIEFYEKNFNMVGASSKVNVLKELLMEDK